MSFEGPVGAGLPRKPESQAQEKKKLEVKSYGAGMEAPSPQKRAAEVARIKAEDLATAEALQAKIAALSGEAMGGGFGSQEIASHDLDLTQLSPGEGNLSFDEELENAFDVATQEVPAENNQAEHERRTREALARALESSSKKEAAPDADDRWE